MINKPIQQEITEHFRAKISFAPRPRCGTWELTPLELVLRLATLAPLARLLLVAGAGSAPAAASSVMLSSGNISGALSSARACAAPASSSPAAAVSRLKLSLRRGSGPGPPPAGLSPAPQEEGKMAFLMINPS